MDDEVIDAEAPVPAENDELTGMVAARRQSIRTYLRLMRVKTFLNVRL